MERKARERRRRSGDGEVETPVPPLIEDSLGLPRNATELFCGIAAFVSGVKSGSELSEVLARCRRRGATFLKSPVMPKNPKISSRRLEADGGRSSRQLSTQRLC